jgi:hypothetical protein
MSIHLYQGLICLYQKAAGIRISYNFTPNIMLALGTYAFAGEEKAKNLYLY